MTKRLMKVIAKIREDFRIKQAMTEFENRFIRNEKIAMYQHKKMMELSKQLRKKLRENHELSNEDYFVVLSRINDEQRRDSYNGVIKKKTQKNLIVLKEGLKDDATGDKG